MVSTIRTYSLIMKDLHNIFEGILSNDLENDIEANVLAAKINKINVGISAPTCKDAAGRKVKVGDILLMWQPGQLVLGRLVEFSTPTQYMIEALDNPENIYYPCSNCVLKVKNSKKIGELIKAFGL